MKFSNRTIYDKERLIRFNNFVVLKKRFFWVLMIVCTVLVSLSFALTLALKNYDSTILLCFSLIVIIDIMYVFCYLILPRITINKAIALNADIFFEFHTKHSSRMGTIIIILYHITNLTECQVL